MADYDRAIGLDPSFALAYYNRGRAWRIRNDRDRALADLNESIRLNPNYAPAFGNRARLYRDMGEADRAFDDFAETLRLNPAATRDQYDGSSARSRIGSNGARSMLRAAPSAINSARASPVAGALRMPQTLWPVAT